MDIQSPIYSETQISPREYLLRERAAEYKSEFVDGQIRAMSGASRAHSFIVLNLGRELSTRFRDRDCEAHISEMRVKVDSSGQYTYPDVLALCGEAELEDEHLDTLLNPMLIVEVLSKSTEAYDRGRKFELYRALESVTDYVLVSQDRVRVEHYRRDGGEWRLSVLANLEDALEIEALSVSISLAAIYEKVEFD